MQNIEETTGDKLGEECGVFGIYDFDGNNVASSIYYGLFALQHRGQESCGIAVSDTAGPKGCVQSYKGMGLVNEVFNGENLGKLKGDIGVGHVRYSTAGESTRENAQPLVLNYIKGTLALAHNGNLINTPGLRQELAYGGAIFQTTIDSEVIAYHIARERVAAPTVEEAVARAMRKIQGAYSLVIMSPRKLIGVRDPYGFRPLCIGKRDNAYILASRPVPWIRSARNLSGMYCPGRLSPSPGREFLPIPGCACPGKRKPDACSSIYTLRDPTAILTA